MPIKIRGFHNVSKIAIQHQLFIVFGLAKRNLVGSNIQGQPNPTQPEKIRVWPGWVDGLVVLWKLRNFIITT